MRDPIFVKDRFGYREVVSLAGYELSHEFDSFALIFPVFKLFELHEIYVPVDSEHRRSKMVNSIDQATLERINQITESRETF